MSHPQILLPGDEFPKIANIQHDNLGQGLHLSKGKAYASVGGVLSHTDSTFSVHRNSPTAAPSPKLPYITAIVHARVIRISPRQAHVTILAIDDAPCAPGARAAADGGFAGLIRQQDIRATEKDRVLVADSFAVGDLVRAEVLSLGDERHYYLTTARNELGVLLAADEDSRGVLTPISWREVLDVRTGARRLRKVARPETVRGGDAEAA